MRLIVMLSGYARSGKDTAAALLVEEYGFQRLAFADPLKQDVSRRTGLPLEYFTTARKDEPLPPDALHPDFPTAKTPRDMLIQHAAAERSRDNHIYARYVRDAIAESPPYSRIVITDWRYRSEASVIAELIDAANYVVYVRITRPDVSPSHDPSEHDLDSYPIDIRIMNSGGLRDLRQFLTTSLRPYLHTHTHATLNGVMESGQE
jgi:hypothetical protein